MRAFVSARDGPGVTGKKCSLCGHNLPFRSAASISLKEGARQNCHLPLLEGPDGSEPIRRESSSSENSILPNKEPRHESVISSCWMVPSTSQIATPPSPPLLTTKRFPFGKNATPKIDGRLLRKIPFGLRVIAS